MSKIPLKIFNVLWEEIRRREHKTDFGLAKTIGLSNGTVSQWRAGKVKSVLPNVLSLIENELNYKIRLKENGEWDIKKLNSDGGWGVEDKTVSADTTQNIDKSERADESGDEMISVLKKHGIVNPKQLSRLLWRVETIYELLCEENEYNKISPDYFTNKTKLDDKKKSDKIGFHKGFEIHG